MTTDKAALDLARSAAANLDSFALAVPPALTSTQLFIARAQLGAALTILELGSARGQRVADQELGRAVKARRQLGGWPWRLGLSIGTSLPLAEKEREALRDLAEGA